MASRSPAPAANSAGVSARISTMSAIGARASSSRAQRCSALWAVACRGSRMPTLFLAGSPVIPSHRPSVESGAQPTLPLGRLSSYNSAGRIGLPRRPWHPAEQGMFPNWTMASCMTSASPIHQNSPRTRKACIKQKPHAGGIRYRWPLSTWTVQNDPLTFLIQACADVPVPPDHGEARDAHRTERGTRAHPTAEQPADLPPPGVAGAAKTPARLPCRIVKRGRVGSPISRH